MNLLIVEMRRALHGRVVRVLILMALHRVRIRGRDRVHQLGRQDARRAARGRRHTSRGDARLVDRRERRRRPRRLGSLPAARRVDRRCIGRRRRMAGRNDHDGLDVGAAPGALAPVSYRRVRDPGRAHRLRAPDRVPGVVLAVRARRTGRPRASTGIGGSRSSSAMLRIGLFTAIGAMLGVALATIGRNTAFALVAVLRVGRGSRGRDPRDCKPGLAQFLWGENMRPCSRGPNSRRPTSGAARWWRS